MNIERYLHKRNVVESGYEIICSDEELSPLEVDVKNIRSIRNPKQVGILDAWLAWVKEGYAGDNALILAVNKKSDEFAL
jgi:hypothetical protein